MDEHLGKVKEWTGKKIQKTNKNKNEGSKEIL